MLFGIDYLCGIWCIDLCKMNCYKAYISSVQNTTAFLFATFQSARSPDGSRSKWGLCIQISVHFNHFQMANS